MSRASLALPLYAAGLAVFFSLCLAPFSGPIGGLLFFLTGWAIPTLINLLLTTWIVGRFPVRSVSKYALFLPVSFLLGSNFYLPRLISCLTSPKEEVIYIRHPIQYGPKTKVDIPSRSRPSVIINPLSPPVAVGGDEGCMCLYFVPGSPDWFSRTYDLIRKATANDILSIVTYDYLPAELPSGIHFDIVFEPNATDPDKVDFLLDVFDGSEKSATFSKRNVLFDPDVDQRAGQEKTLKSRYFLQNCTDLLLHNNQWTALLPLSASQFPTQDLRRFLDQVLSLP